MSNTGSMIQRACSFCRKRKLRCDKQLPRCQSCIRLGHRECDYVAAKPGQYRQRPERSHVQELEERLKRVERLLRSSHAGPPDGSHPSPQSDVGHSEIERNEVNIMLDAETIRDLEEEYFRTIHPIMSIVHYTRYTSYQTPNVEAWPPLYLRYSIWAVAALRSDTHSQKSDQYYKTARHLIEAAGLKDPRCLQSAINCAQSWLHLAMFDVICGRYALSWTNTSQAIRLLQIAKVHALDSTTSLSHSTIAQNLSWSENEEKRRAFWCAFCLDRTAFVGQGLPVLIDENDIQVNLPASDNAYQSSTEEPTLSLLQATTLGESHSLSLMAAMVVIHSTCSSKLKYLQQLDAISIQKIFATNPLLQNSRPGENLTAVFSVPPHLLVTEANIDTSLLFLNMVAHCATICVHLVAQKLVQANTSRLAIEFIQHCKHECETAAFTIYELTKLASCSNLQNHHPASSYCIYHALVIFADCFTAHRDVKYSTPIKFLFDFMGSLSKRSQVASSVFRDLEAEYPSLVIELSSKNDEATIAMTFDKSTFQPSQGDTSRQAGSTKDMPNDSPAQGYGDTSSSMTKSTGYDWTEELYWENQVVDSNYVSQLQTPSNFSVGGQSSLQPPNS